MRIERLGGIRLIAGRKRDVLKVAMRVCDLRRALGQLQSSRQACVESILEKSSNGSIRGSNCGKNSRTCSPVSLVQHVQLQNVVQIRVHKTYIVLFKQLTGTKSPFTYSLLFPLTLPMTFSSAALTDTDRKRQNSENA